MRLKVSGGLKERALFLAWMLLAPAVWSADFDKEFEVDVWTETDAKLPAFPDQSNLIPFSVGTKTDTKFLIDGGSISVGSDGVVRYTLVIVSAQGARNVSYEGMRCETTERKYYAFGRPDGTWSQARSDKWVRINRDGNNHHSEIFFNYFCPGKSLAIRDAEDARRILRSGGVSGR